MLSGPAGTSPGERRINLEVRMVTGDLVADMWVSPEDTVGCVKHRILARREALPQNNGYSVLVCGCWALKDRTRISDCPGVSLARLEEGTHEPLMMTIVQRAPSNLAAHLRHLEGEGLEIAGMSEVADSVFQAEHEQSLKSRPDGAQILNGISQMRRAAVAAWLGAACSAAWASDELLHGAMLTFDRYTAVGNEDMHGQVNADRLQKLTLACLSAELKLTSCEDFPLSWLRGLAQGHDMRDILQVEYEVLRSLDFNVGAPTPFTILNGLSLRLRQFPGGLVHDDGDNANTAVLKLVLAHILLEMALYDVELQYSFPPVALAAGALSAAILSVGMPGLRDLDTASLSFENLKAQHARLMDDISSYCPGECNIQGQVRLCEERILMLWQESFLDEGGCFARFHSMIFQRHQRGRILVATGNASELGDWLRALSPDDGLANLLLVRGDGKAGNGVTADHVRPPAPRRTSVAAAAAGA